MADIPDDNHVVRHVPYKHLVRDGGGSARDAEGKPYGPLPQAFALREIDEDKLSVNWIEYFEWPNHKDGVGAAVESLRTLRPQKKLSGYAVGKVSDVTKVYHDAGHKKVKVVHDGNKVNPSHTLIIRLPDNQLEIMQALVSSAFTEVYLDDDF